MTRRRTPFQRPFPRPRCLPGDARRTGFTLVELLVAVALMVILSASIMFVFVQAQKIFMDTTKKTEVYENARTAIDIMERDLANMVKTADMEFFRDHPTDPNGHFDGGGEHIGGATLFWHQPGMEPYVYATTLRERWYEDETGERHANDAIYFKTLGTEGGQTQALLVTYHLDYLDTVTGKPHSHPVLRRIVQVFETDPFPRYSDALEEDLCYFVTDFRIEWYLQNRRSKRPGDYLTASQAARGIYKADRDGKQMLGPRFCLNIDPEQGEGYSMVNTYYRHHEGDGHPMGRVYSYGNGRGYFVPGDGALFHMLGPGDRIFIFDVEKAPARGGAKPQPYLPFEFRDLVVRQVKVDDDENPTQTLEILFDEDLDTGRMDAASPPKQFIEVNYRSGWLPPAVRITLRIKDEKNKAPRTVQRVIKLLGG